MKNRSLYIPERVSLYSEVWRGLSVVDAAKSLGVGMVVVAISFALKAIFFFDVFWCMMASLVAAALSITLHTRYNSGLSPMDYIRIMMKFAREQKHYFYIHTRRLDNDV